METVTLFVEEFVNEIRSTINDEMLIDRWIWCDLLSVSGILGGTGNVVSRLGIGPPGPVLARDSKMAAQISLSVSGLYRSRCPAQPTPAARFHQNGRGGSPCDSIFCLPIVSRRK